MPNVVAESSSEAVFIASRLQQQDEQLALHAKDAGAGPLLANAHHAAAAAAAAAGSDAADDAAAGDAGGAAADADAGEPEDEGGDAAAEWSSSSGMDAEAPAGDTASAAAAKTAAAGKKAKFKPLQPLIVLRMTGEHWWRCVPVRLLFYAAVMLPHSANNANMKQRTWLL